MCSDPLMVCSGGYPENSDKAPQTITVQHGKSITMLSCRATILDFLCLSSSPYSCGKCGVEPSSSSVVRTPLSSPLPSFLGLHPLPPLPRSPASPALFSFPPSLPPPHSPSPPPSPPPSPLLPLLPSHYVNCLCNLSLFIFESVNYHFCLELC